MATNQSAETSSKEESETEEEEDLYQLLAMNYKLIKVKREESDDVKE